MIIDRDTIGLLDRVCFYSNENILPIDSKKSIAKYIFNTVLDKKNLSMKILFFKDYDLCIENKRIAQYKKIWKNNVPNVLNFAVERKPEVEVFCSNEKLLYAVDVSLELTEASFLESCILLHDDYNRHLLYFSSTDYSIALDRYYEIYKLLLHGEGIFISDEDSHNIMQILNDDIFFLRTWGFYDDAESGIDIFGNLNSSLMNDINIKSCSK